MPPEKIDSLADDVKPLVLGLLRQIRGLTARVDLIHFTRRISSSNGSRRTLLVP